MSMPITGLKGWQFKCPGGLFFSLAFLMTLCACSSVKTGNVQKTDANQTPFFDDFNSIDPSVWEAEKYSFPDDACDQSPEQVTASGSILSIKTESVASPGSGKVCRSGGLSTRRFFGYGKFSARLKTHLKPGMDDGFFIMSQWQASGWKHQEVDFEFLGNDSGRVQVNVHKYLDHEGTPSNGGQLPKMIDLGFDSGKDFHIYTIDWKKEELDFYVDGKLVHTESRNIPDQPMNLRIESFAVNPDNGWGPQWAGKFDPANLPASVEFDWVRYESH
jgi:beta-glucanase (GH16 family)